MTHRFKVGQRVRMTRPTLSTLAVDTGGVYQIVRLMPSDQTGEPAYRIKSGTNERAVRESEIGDM